MEENANLSFSRTRVYWFIAITVLTVNCRDLIRRHASTLEPWAASLDLLSLFINDRNAAIRFFRSSRSLA